MLKAEAEKYNYSNCQNDFNCYLSSDVYRRCLKSYLPRKLVCLKILNRNKAKGILIKLSVFLNLKKLILTFLSLFKDFFVCFFPVLEFNFHTTPPNM